jgi:hypothetical protein
VAVDELNINTHTFTLKLTPLVGTGPLPVCHETKLSKYNNTVPSVSRGALYKNDPRHWRQFQVNPQVFRSGEGGALLLNGDLDYNSPMLSAQLTQK